MAQYATCVRCDHDCVLFAGQDADAAERGEHFWPFLKSKGWKHTEGRGLISYLYLKPGVSRKDAVRGETVFTEEELVKYVTRNQHILEEESDNEEESDVELEKEAEIEKKAETGKFEAVGQLSTSVPNQGEF